MKTKRNCNIKYLKLALIAQIFTLLICTEVAASDLAKQDDSSKEAAAASPATQDNNKTATISLAPVAKTDSEKKANRLPYYAKVGNMFITWMDYNFEYANEARKKFYHSKPSESLAAVFQRQIGDTLVTNAMLVQEAKRRKIKPDDAFVKQQTDKYEQTFAQNPNWPEARTRVLPILTERMRNESLRNKIETLVRNVPPPSTKQLRKYYAAHPEKFTSPPQQRVGVILLRVDPGASDADWQKANEEGQNLVKRIRAGEEFADLARQYSGDKTAEDGGDMGFLHEGMLPGLPSEAVSKLQPGETSDPVNLMEGVSIFHLTERRPPELKSFKSSQDRAKDLLLKEQSESAWNSLIAKLKKNTPVQVDESHFLPLPVATEKPAESTGITNP